VITYVDSSLIVRALLPDEPGHERARAILDDPGHSMITGSWSVVEVTGALVRAVRAFRGDERALFAAFENDVDPVDGRIVVVDAMQAEVESIARSIVRRTGIRSLDAWHLACAQLAFEDLAEPGEVRAFATHDTDRAAIARELGFTVI
jgi:predicted nucleic acid-binding protein